MISTKRITAAGTEIWELPNGKLHRENGPAVTYTDGVLRWYLNGQLYWFDEYCKELKLYYGNPDEDIMMIKMSYS